MKGINTMKIVKTVNIACRFITITVLCLPMATTASAQTHEGHSASMNHKSLSLKDTTTRLPEQSGQAAFMAISEIIELLENDPSTDWSAVSIDSLRNHLVDMDRLTLDSDVLTKTLGATRLSFHITGIGQTLESIQRMVPAHASVIRQSSDWLISIEQEPNGVTLVIDTNNPDDLVKLRALGFFGFMAMGSHHPLHHYQMAMGQTH